MLDNVFYAFRSEKQSQSIWFIEESNAKQENVSQESKYYDYDSDLDSEKDTSTVPTTINIELNAKNLDANKDTITTNNLNKTQKENQASYEKSNILNITNLTGNNNESFEQSNHDITKKLQSSNLNTKDKCTKKFNYIITQV